MKYQHKSLAGGRWKKLSFVEQMANVGSEVERTISWRKKENYKYSDLAFLRVRELLDLTVSSNNKYSKLKELTRLRECLNDYFLGKNKFGSSDRLWSKYFLPFNMAARIGRG